MALFESDMVWIKENCCLITADAELPPGHSRTVAQLIDRASLDVILAAKGKELLLISEDFGLRSLARELLNVKDAWLQPVLMAARKRKLISPERYSELLSVLINARHTFISVGSLDLRNIARANKWALDGPLRNALTTLGIPEIDLSSSAGVCGSFLTHAWRELPTDAARAITFAALNILTEKHWSRGLELLRQIVTRATSELGSATLHKVQFREAVRDWMRGYFLAGS